MIAPIVGFPLRGVLWYQGESNVAQAADYAELTEVLIADWRAKWKSPDMPFLYVQLANHKDRSDDPGARTQIAPFREAQTAALRVPHTGMAVAIDIGDAKDIHPKNKQEVGHRLALIARAQVYGEKELPYSGPVLASARAEGGQVRLKFQHDRGGLRTRGDQLKGFAMAGPDGKFVWAKARVEDGSVVLSSESVTKPTQVRYAWADNPEATLINGAGLPAVPFSATVAP